jgi:CIC family chloride channel protein
VTFTLIQKSRLYSDQVPTRRDSPAHGGEYVLDVLQDLKVSEVFVRCEVTVVERSMPLAVLLRQATESSQVVFPVAGEDGRPEGIVTLDTIKAYFHDESVGMLAIAADCETPFVSVSTQDSLALALENMAKAHYQQLPVVDSVAGTQLVGLISYDELLQSYTRELALRRDLGQGGDGDEASPLA